MGWWHRVWHRWSKIGTHIWVPRQPETYTLMAEVYLLTNARTRIQPREVVYTGHFNAKDHRAEFSADSQIFTLCEHEELSVVAIEATVSLRQFHLGDGFIRVRTAFRCPPQSPLLEPNRHWHIGPPHIFIS